MKKSQFSESQIVAILKEADAGLKVAEICRKHGISQPTYYNWKSKYGGMSASELKRIKEIEAEHAKLKRMFADLAMENEALKELIEKSSDADGEAGDRNLAQGAKKAPSQSRLQGRWHEYLKLVSDSFGSVIPRCSHC
ncbi:transposase [Akkermansiaceae bacterium]|nr:transposase [Akkermansiaceae bacterium]